MRDTGCFLLESGGMAWGCNDIYGLLGGLMASSLQSLIFLIHSSLAIGQQYLNVVLPFYPCAASTFCIFAQTELGAVPS